MIKKVNWYPANSYWKTSVDIFKYPVLEITFSDRASYQLWLDNLAGNFLAFHEGSGENEITAEFVVTENFLMTTLKAIDVVRDSSEELDVNLLCDEIGSKMEI